MNSKSAPDALFLYDVSVSYTEGSAKARPVGPYICSARDEADAFAQAKAELWCAPFDTAGRKPHFDARVLPRYLACEAWSHLLVATKESITRWTMDRITSQLIDADIRAGATGNKWVALDAAQRADLLESLQDNEVEACPADHDVDEVESLPAWSAAA